MNKQCQQVLTHLERETITPLDALSLYGIGRLAARVNDLRKSGYDIATEMIKVETRAGSSRVARYRLQAGQRELFA